MMASRKLTSAVALRVDIARQVLLQCARVTRRGLSGVHALARVCLDVHVAFVVQEAQRGQPPP